MPIVKVNSRKRMKKFSNRVRLLSLSSFVILFASAVVVAQVPAAPRPSPTPPPNPVDGTIKGQDSNPPMTSMEEEMRAKREERKAKREARKELHDARVKKSKEDAHAKVEELKSKLHQSRAGASA